MKKLAKKLFPLTLLLGLLFVLLPVSQSSAQNPDDMVYKGEVTVWFWTGIYWQDLPGGYIYKDMSTGRLWLKITHGRTKKAVVLSNRDYNGSFIDGGQRTYRKHCATPDLTYYFDVPDSFFQ